jgi:hypothetical protein
MTSIGEEVEGTAGITLLFNRLHFDDCLKTTFEVVSYLKKVKKRKINCCAFTPYHDFVGGARLADHEPGLLV